MKARVYLLLFLVLTSCTSATLPEKTLAFLSAVEFDPYIYREFEEAGGNIECISLHENSNRFFSNKDPVFLNIQNNNEKDLCFFGLKSWRNNDQYELEMIGAVNLGNKQFFENFNDELYNYPAKINLALVVEPNMSFKLELDLDDRPVILPTGQYVMYFHVFAPYCDSLPARGNYYLEQVYDHVPLKEDWFSWHGRNADFTLNYGAIAADGDILTLQNTPGVLFVVKIPVTLG